jgi:hypothetical protein
MGPAARLAAGGYVVVVVVLVAAAFRDPDQDFSATEAIGLGLTLPVLLAALPVVYLVGAAAWSLTGAADGGPMWPVTLTFALMFAGVAVANLWVLRTAARALHRRPRRGRARN